MGNFRRPFLLSRCPLHVLFQGILPSWPPTACIPGHAPLHWAYTHKQHPRILHRQASCAPEVSLGQEGSPPYIYNGCELIGVPSSQCLKVPRIWRHPSCGKRCVANKVGSMCVTRNSGRSSSGLCTGGHMRFGILSSSPVIQQKIVRRSKIIASISWVCLANNQISPAHPHNVSLYSWMITPYPNCSHRGFMSLYTSSKIHGNNVSWIVHRRPHRHVFLRCRKLRRRRFGREPSALPLRRLSR